MILVVASEKGGSGKSCTAQNLTVWLRRKDRDVLLIDADPQRNTVEWAEERELNTTLLPLTVEEMHGDIRLRLIDRIKRYDAIVIDVGGADSDALRGALNAATHALFTFRPKRRDLRTLKTVEKWVSSIKVTNPDLIVRSLITQAPALPSQVQRILDAKEACASYGLNPLQVFTVQRNIYDDSDEDGCTVLETPHDTSAVEEIEQIASELWGGEEWA